MWYVNTSKTLKNTSTRRKWVPSKVTLGCCRIWSTGTKKSLARSASEKLLSGPEPTRMSCGCCIDRAIRVFVTVLFFKEISCVRFKALYDKGENLYKHVK